MVYLDTDCLFQFELEQHLGLYMRDEIIAWHLVNGKAVSNERSLHEMVDFIVDQIVKKAELLSCRMERETAVSHRRLACVQELTRSSRWCHRVTSRSWSTPFKASSVSCRKPPIPSSFHGWQSSGYPSGRDSKSHAFVAFGSVGGQRGRFCGFQVAFSTKCSVYFILSRY